MELRESEFDDMVLNSDRPVLVDFWASWCPPCKMMQPVVDKLAVKVAEWADVYSVNIDRNPSLASRYQISGVPTFVSFAQGDAVDRKTGALTEGQLIGLLKSAEERFSLDTVAHGSSCDSGPDGPRQCLPVASATGTTCNETQSPERATQVDDGSLCRAVGPLGQFQAFPGPHGPGRDCAGPSGPETQDNRKPFITIVSGLPRSGTSLMMRMLNAGGIPALCDEQRTPDADNPNGYYEFEDVKSLESYDSWLPRAPGHAVKMVYSLLKHLPVDREYRVIFMRRHFEEILQSQKTMLERQGIATDIPDATLKTLFERELRQFYSWVSTQKHLKLINVSYNELLSRPDSTIAHIDRHLEHRLDTDAMVHVIDPSLYRNRAA